MQGCYNFRAVANNLKVGFFESLFALNHYMTAGQMEQSTTCGFNRAQPGILSYSAGGGRSFSVSSSSSMVTGYSATSKSIFQLFGKCASPYISADRQFVYTLQAETLFMVSWHYWHCMSVLSTAAGD